MSVKIQKYIKASLGPGTRLQRMLNNHPGLHTECPWEVFKPEIQIKDLLISLQDLSITEPTLC